VEKTNITPAAVRLPLPLLREKGKWIRQPKFYEKEHMPSRINQIMRKMPEKRG